MSLLSLAVIGGRGRLGSAIVRLAEADHAFDDATVPAGRVIPLLNAFDVVVDVSHHSATDDLLAQAVLEKVPLVIGTTGHTPEERERIAQASGKIAIVLASNFSVGVNVLFHLTRKAAEILGAEYDQEIVEMHHRNKLDAPSGTARSLAEILCEVKGKSYDELVQDGRSGEPGKRTRDEIGMHALRGGDVIGDHTVTFAGIGERIELTHKASNRDVFAMGALRAAKWVQTAQPGLYSMQDVLGLK
ncbi:dihydrodipicolinate reductase [Verrucomicrobium sp. GAS474]|uniref:4-hydroxy-tetrahydrodipicolinate reductase n=1 Tax=Verrucomicrobium sp. GAS474 TaxID=1882831 RepID=UPI000879D430|nr:4-hydroxy-tetrahydrodipicolinate reductase [Verrucomicrobium sp. GAS474]SDU09537.1 dihydrodipicolinate reductase [Verrucomicrobium sp. GAS474]